MPQPLPDWADWAARWERMQDGHLPGREERSAVLVDCCHAAGAAPRVLELGCGPGGILRRLRRGHPRSSLVGVDHDPLLLTIAAAIHDGDDGVRLVDADLRDPDWVAALGPAPFDAVVSSTALHWLGPDDLARVYQQAHDLLRPGGIFANADHFAFDDEGLDRLARTASAREEAAARAAGTGETWDAWWAALAQVPAAATLLEERARRFPPSDAHHGHHLGEAWHRAALAAAGFHSVTTAWRWYDSAVLIGRAAPPADPSAQGPAPH